MEFAPCDRVSDSLSHSYAPHSHLVGSHPVSVAGTRFARGATHGSFGDRSSGLGLGRMQSRQGGLGGEVQCPEARRAGGALAVDLRTVEVVALAVVARFGAQIIQMVVGH